jgi:hypothetical protein
MDGFLRMDIFFMVTTFCVVFLTVLIGLVFWKLLRILKHVERIAEVAGREAENLREDAAYLRGRLLGALDAMFSFVPRRRRREEPTTENDAQVD